MLIELLRAASREDEARKQVEVVAQELESRGDAVGRRKRGPASSSMKRRPKWRRRAPPPRPAAGGLVFLDTGVCPGSAARDDAPLSHCRAAHRHPVSGAAGGTTPGAGAADRARRWKWLPRPMSPRSRSHRGRATRRQRPRRRRSIRWTDRRRGACSRPTARARSPRRWLEPTDADGPIGCRWSRSKASRSPSPGGSGSQLRRRRGAGADTARSEPSRVPSSRRRSSTPTDPGARSPGGSAAD